MNINEAAQRLNDIWQDEIRRGTSCYKWAAVGVGENEIYLYLDCKKLPPAFAVYGYEVIPIRSERPKPC